MTFGEIRMPDQKKQQDDNQVKRPYEKKPDRQNQDEQNNTHRSEDELEKS